MNNINEHHALIVSQKYQQRILGFALLQGHVLYTNSGPKLTCGPEFDI